MFLFAHNARNLSVMGAKSRRDDGADFALPKWGRAKVGPALNSVGAMRQPFPLTQAGSASIRQLLQAVDPIAVECQMPGDGGDCLEGLFVAPYGVACVPTIGVDRIVRCLALVRAVRLVIGSLQYREIDILPRNVDD